MFMGAGGMMGGLAQGGNFSNLQFSQWQREMTATAEARSMSMERTLGRFGIETGMAKGISSFMPMLNMIDPSLGQTVDSVMSFAAGNTHLTASGLAAADQYARMGGAIPGEAGYRDDLNRGVKFATSGGVGFAGRSADHRMAMRLIDRTASDDDLNRNFGLAGAIQELQHGLGWDMGKILDTARVSGTGSLAGLASRSHVYGNLTTMSGGRLGAGMQLIDSMGAGGAQFQGLIAAGGVASLTGQLSGVSEGVLGGVAMQTATKVAGGKDLKTAQAIAEVDPALYAKLQSAIASGDMKTAERIMQDFRSGKDAGMVSSAGNRAMARLDESGVVAKGLAKLDLARDAQLLGGAGLVKRLSSLRDEDYAAILSDDMTSVRGFLNNNTRSLIKRTALSRLADKGEGTLGQRVQDANGKVIESGVGAADPISKISDNLTKIVGFIESGNLAGALKTGVTMLMEVMQGRPAPTVTAETKTP
jgi:hypothetical protein